MSQPKSWFERLAILGLASSLLMGLSACAPEPGDETGRTDKDKETINPETEWGGQDLAEDDLQTELPATFPVDAFVLPKNAVIYNTGERGQDQWFIVLQAVNEDDAKTLWDEIISTNAFEVVDTTKTTEDGMAATLNGVVLTVQALTIPQEDGSVQLSYDITRWAEMTE